MAGSDSEVGADAASRGRGGGETRYTLNLRLQGPTAVMSHIMTLRRRANKATDLDLQRFSMCSASCVPRSLVRDRLFHLFGVVHGNPKADGTQGDECGFPYLTASCPSSPPRRLPKGVLPRHPIFPPNLQYRRRGHHGSALALVSARGQLRHPALGAAVGAQTHRRTCARRGV